MGRDDTFSLGFTALTGHAPFPWQRALFDALLQSSVPKTCDIPTGLGKTSAIAVWLLALAHRAQGGAVDFPRRLIYVVNRRTVVDQASRQAAQMRDALAKDASLRPVANALRSLASQPSDQPLAISTLRGRFADNAEWRSDPARPAVIIGTVDMIGSRLLFAGYGCGFKSSPLHAGFLGQGTLLVHDEAHLEPAFQALLEAIELEQQRCAEFAPLRVLAMSATSRSATDKPDEHLHLTDADCLHQEVRKRVEAKKGIAFHRVADEKNVAGAVEEQARKSQGSGQAILVFLRKVEDVERVAASLRKNHPVQMLTGTVRGLERDRLTGDPIFERFVSGSTAVQQPGTVYLICTSAGEVGVNISADHLVCDLTPFDSTAQRFGRVNRFGDGDANIDVIVHDWADSKFDEARRLTMVLLQQLPIRQDGRYDGSPSALGELPLADRLAAFAPPPDILPATDILLDRWALTSIRERFPGRPPVAAWLHGVSTWERPETHVAWREEVEALTPALLERLDAADLLEGYPLKPHELLRDRTDRIFKHLETLAARHPDLYVWILEDNGRVSPFTLRNVAESGPDALEDRIVVLPPAAGGLAFNSYGGSTGTLDGDSQFDDARRSSYDVADEWLDEDNTQRRRRIWDDDPLPSGMRLICTIDVRPDAEDEGVAEEDNDEPVSHRRFWRWYVKPRAADDQGSRTGRCRQGLEQHLKSAEQIARTFCVRLGLGEPETVAVVLAARWHDLGKHREIWQRSIGNHRFPVLALAKSDRNMNVPALNGYRHEFGSLIDVSSLPEFKDLAPRVQDLVLHLIAAHHGRARPHFGVDEAFDPEHADREAENLAREVPRRFSRLQRKYGRWGLAYLESLVRAADILASQRRDLQNDAPDLSAEAGAAGAR